MPNKDPKIIEVENNTDETDVDTETLKLFIL